MDSFLCKLLVDLDVSLPVVGDEGGPVRHGVEQRPECAIAAPIVVAVEEVRLCTDGDNLQGKELNST